MADAARVGLVIIVLGGLYLLSAPRTVVLEDDGLFILSAWFLGVEHPPGYPLYVLLGKLATLWPFGSPAWRVHALSGLFGALACGVLFLIARRLLPAGVPGLPPTAPMLAAWLAALGLGVSATFWSQAIIADVYTLHALLLFGLLLVSLVAHGRLRDGRDLGRLPAAAALLTGLGLANHWPLLLLSAPGVALLWWRGVGVLLLRLPRLLLWLGVGLLPYAWMIWRSHTEPAISFQGSLDSVGEVLDFVLRRGYAEVDNSSVAGAGDKLLFLAFLLRQAASQLLLPGAALALLGFAVQWRRWGWTVSAALTLAFLGPTLVLVVLLDFAYEPLQREAFRVYPTAAWGIFAVWVGLGLLAAAEAVVRRFGHAVPPARRGAVLIGTTMALLILVTAVHGPRNARADAWLARAQAETILGDLAPDAVLLVGGDLHLPALAYLQRIEGVRPDVQLASRGGLLLEPRLFDPYRTPRPAQRTILEDFMQRTDRPVYTILDHTQPAGVITWLTYRVPDAPATADPARLVLTDAERKLLQRLVKSGPMRDGWSEFLRRFLLERFAAFQARAEVEGQWPSDVTARSRLVAQTLRLPEAALARAAELSDLAPRKRAAEVERLLAQFAAGADGAWIGHRHLAKYYNVLARTAQLQGRPAVAAEALARYRALRPDGPEPTSRSGADGVGMGFDGR